MKIVSMIALMSVKLRENSKANLLFSGLIILFFVGGIINHSLPFSGMTNDGRSSLWHGFNTLLALSGIFSVLSGRQLGWYWLMTLFLTQTAVELRGVQLSIAQPILANQVTEAGLNVVGLIFLLLSRDRYQN